MNRLYRRLAKQFKMSVEDLMAWVAVCKAVGPAEFKRLVMAQAGNVDLGASQIITFVIVVTVLAALTPELDTIATEWTGNALLGTIITIAAWVVPLSVLWAAFKKSTNDLGL